MTPSARLFSAQDILNEWDKQQKPLTDILRDWGKGHRFAGSKDRAAIAGIVYDCLRCRLSAQCQMDDATARATVLGMLKRVRGLPLPDVAGLFSGEKFSSPVLNATEMILYERDFPENAPLHAAGDFPECITISLETVFGENVVSEMHAMIFRASLDLRVNVLKAQREDVLRDLEAFVPSCTPYCPWGIRIPLGEGKAPSVQQETSFLKGDFEIQDEGSQLVALLCKPFAQGTIIDLCAGGGGKTLALAAMADNQSKIYAGDSKLARILPIQDRLKRSGVTNVTLCLPDGQTDIWKPYEHTADLVVVDAPCSGTGTWRRSPESKWRLSPSIIKKRIEDQEQALDKAAELVKPGGCIAYITCSVLPEENDENILSFHKRHTNYTFLDIRSVLKEVPVGSLEENVYFTRFGLMMTPLRTLTDGFYISFLQRSI